MKPKLDKWVSDNIGDVTTLTSLGDTDYVLVVDPTSHAVKKLAVQNDVARLGSAETYTASKTLNDSVKAILGTGGDWHMYFDGNDLIGPNPTGGLWADCPNLSSPGAAQYAYGIIEHFVGVGKADAGPWTVDGTDSACKVEFNDEAGGVLKVTTGGTDGDYTNMVLGDADTPCYTFGMGASAIQKKLWFEAKIKCSTGSPGTANFAIGLAGNTNILQMIAADGSLQVNDFVGFRAKEDAAGELDFVVVQDGTATEVKANIVTHADSWIRAGFLYDGSTTVTPYINDSASSSNSVETDATNFPGDELLAPGLCMQTGTGDYDELVDYIMCVQLL